LWEAGQSTKNTSQGGVWQRLRVELPESSRRRQLHMAEVGRYKNASGYCRTCFGRNALNADMDFSLKANLSS